MKLLRMWYMPEADVEFTWTDVECLILLSERHYDYKCQELSKQGGMLYGMRNMFSFPLNLGTEDDKAIRRTATITYRLDATEANLLAKCSESDPSLLYRLVPIFKALNDEYLKINAENRRAERSTIFSTDTNLSPEQVLPPGSPGSIRRY